MADIRVEMEINESGDHIDSVTSAQSVNNVSKPLSGFSIDTQNPNNGFNGICIGKYRIGDLGAFLPSTGYDGYMFGVVDSNKLYDLTLTLDGTSLDSIKITFDNAAQQWATVAIIDGDTANPITNNSIVWDIIFPTISNSHTIKFTTWNRADYNACFTAIETLPNKMIFDKRWIKEVESLAQLTPNPSEVKFGVLANTGSLKLIDRNNKLAQYASAGYFTRNDFPISIFANGKQIQSHLATDTEYDTNARTLNIEMSNKLAKWDDIKFSGMPLQDPMTLYDILNYICEASTVGEDAIDIGIVPNYDNKFTLEFCNLDYVKDNVIKINASPDIFATVESNSEFSLPAGHKCFVSYAVKGSWDNPVEAQVECSLTGENIELYDVTKNSEWKVVNAIIQSETGTYEKMRFYYTNMSQLPIYIKDIIFYDLTANGYESASLDWCKNNLKPVNSICSKNIKSRIYSDGLNEFVDFDITVKMLLKSINIPYPYLKESSLRVAFDKICQIAQLFLACDDNGDIRLYNALPVLSSYEAPLPIPTRLQMSPIKRSLILKNKYNRAEVPTNKITIDRIQSEERTIEPYDDVTTFASEPIIDNIFQEWGQYGQQKFGYEVFEISADLGIRNILPHHTGVGNEKIGGVDAPYKITPLGSVKLSYMPESGYENFLIPPELAINTTFYYVDEEVNKTYKKIYVFYCIYQRQATYGTQTDFIKISSATVSVSTEVYKANITNQTYKS